MAKFQSGQKKPSGSGRKIGTRNKRSQHLTDALDSLGLDVPSRLAELLPKLSPEKQVDVLMGLMSFLYPKRKAIEHTVGYEEPEEPLVIHFVKAKDGKAVPNETGEEYRIFGSESSVASMEAEILKLSSSS